MDDVEQLLATSVGLSVTRVRRIWYLNPDGSLEGDRGPIELLLSDGSVRLLECGRAGEILRIKIEEWIDAFAPPLAPENVRYIRECGKYAAFDMTGKPPYDGLSGAITNAEPVWRGENLTGTVLTMSTGEVLTVDCDGDKTWVIIGSSDPHYM